MKKSVSLPSMGSSENRGYVQSASFIPDYSIPLTTPVDLRDLDTRYRVDIIMSSRLLFHTNISFSPFCLTVVP